MTNRRYWTTAEVRSLRTLYPDMSNPAIGLQLGRTETAVQLMALKIGLWKSPAFMAGPVVRWQRGNRPWNAGKRYQAGGRSKLTQFKKGHRGARQRPVGSERRTRDGVEVKVAEPNVWTPKARSVWLQHFGEIQAGAIVRCKDGNQENCAPDNLLLITRAEHLRLNWKPRGPAKKAMVRWIAPLKLAA